MKYSFIHEITAPKRAITIEYWGQNPWRIYPVIPGLLQGIFYAKGLHYFEDLFRWDITADPRPFFVMMHLEKGLDKFTRFYIWIKLWGAQPSDPTKNGRVLIEIRGQMYTEYSIGKGLKAIPKALILPFIYFYHLTLYNDVMRRYLRELKARTEKLEAEFRATLNLIMRERLT